MTGKKTIAHCATAILLCSGSIATAAPPSGAFDDWEIEDETITGTFSCPVGFTCSAEVTGEGFYQRQITEDSSGKDYFQTIITDNSEPDPPETLIFSDKSYVQTGSIFDLEDEAAPEIEITAPSQTIHSKHDTFAYYKPFAFLSNVTITDAIYASPDLSPHSDTQIGPLLPGENIVSWFITNPDGVGTGALQTVYNTPNINFGPDQVVVEGDSITVRAHLNGLPNKYPVVIPYVLGGSATNPDDHNGIDGEIIIESGLSGETTIQTYKDDISDAGETITLQILGFFIVGVGNYDFHTITITEQNQPPLIDFGIQQDSIQSKIVSTLSGNVSITTDIKTSQPEAQLSYDWSATDNAILPLNGTQQSSLAFDPATLAPGIYKAQLTVTDSNHLSSSKTLAFLVTDTEIPGTDKNGIDYDNDGIFEEIGDADKDGVPDFIDANKLPNHYIANLFEPSPPTSDKPSLNFRLDPGVDTLGLSIWAPYFPGHEKVPHMIQVQPGLHLSRGALHLLLDQEFQTSVLVPRDLINLADPLFTEENDYSDAQINSGLAHNISNFDINNLPYAGYTAAFVFPLPEAINETPLNFRVLLPSTGWQSFDESDGGIASAKRNGHTCPAPNSPNYQAGLNIGAECLLFKVKDGGPNDSDELANGSISISLGTLIGIEVEPRAVIEDLTLEAPEQVGGGSAMSILFLLFTALGQALRHNANIRDK